MLPLANLFRPLAAITAGALFAPLASATDPRVLSERQTSSTGAGYAEPSSWLTTIPGSNYGEPLNVVISNASSSEVLSDPASYFSSLFFSPNNCLTLSLGDAQAADLGDGQGSVNQTALYRYNFDAGTTTCSESFNGGQHFRYWVQKTTGAIFLAVSVEESAAKNHNIVDDGYDLGRDWFVGNATNSSGTTSPQDKSEYKATSTSVTVNVDASDINHGINIDDQVYVLTVTQTKTGDGSNPTATTSSSKTATSSSAGPAKMAPPPWLLMVALATFTVLLSSTSVLAGVAQPSSPIINRRAYSSDPGVAEGQKLTGESNPDPLPPNKNRYSDSTPTAIDDALRARINTLSPFAAAAYCKGTLSGTWGGSECGTPCEAVPGEVDLLWHEGDGDLDPHKLLLYVHDTKSLVLTTEGSSFSRFFSVLDDIVFIPLPAALPITSTFERFYKSDDDVTVSQNGTGLIVEGLTSLVEDLVGDTTAALATVHGGFEATWARPYAKALANVKSALAKYDVERIITTGHSLGAAVSLLDFLALRNDVDSPVPFEHIGFGSPRVFNPIGAALVDLVVANEDANMTYHHVHHDRDVVVHLGPLILGFEHASHEVFLPDNGTTALLCPGRENLQCSLGKALTLDLSIDDHDGPYLGRLLGRDDAGQCLQ